LQVRNVTNFPDRMDKLVKRPPPPVIPPLFKADSAVLSFSASKDGKVNVNYQGWDAGKVVLDGEVFEVRWGPQRVEGGRIVVGGKASRMRVSISETGANITSPHPVLADDG
jgi:hypothetical protein